MPADGKFIRVDSQLLNSINQKRNLISYLPQESFLPSQLKIRTAIKLFCSASNASKLFSNQLMRPFLNKKTSQLSGGEQRLAEVLLIIHSPAKFILIDEPFNGIAPLYKDELKALITELAINKGFIITDHDHKNIIDISSRIILLFDGGTKEISTKKELMEWGYLPIVK